MAKPALTLLLLTFLLSAVSCASSGPTAPPPVQCPAIQPLSPQDKTPHNYAQRLLDEFTQSEPKPTPEKPI